MPSPANSPPERQHRGGDRRGSSRERSSGPYDSWREEEYRRPVKEYPPRASSRSQANRDRPGRDGPYDRPAKDVNEDDRQRDHRLKEEGRRDDGGRYTDDSARRSDRGLRDRQDWQPNSSRADGRPDGVRADGGSGRSAVPPPPGQAGQASGDGRRPHSRSAAHSRGRTPPPSNRERAAGEERGTPGSAQRKVAAATPLGGSFLLQELIQAGKQKQQQETGDGSDDDAEAGEILPEGRVAGTKRKHSPIVWEPSGPTKQARGPQGANVGVAGESLLERAQREAAALREMAGVDPDAPAAMKASPSLSSDGQQSDGERRGRGNGHDSEELGNGGTHSAPLKAKVVSRWALSHDEEEEEEEGGDGGRQGNGDGVAASGPGAMSTSPAAVGGAGYGDGVGGDRDGQQGGPMDSDSDGEAGRDRAAEAPEKRYDMRKECRDVHNFERIEKISEGTYGVVYKAREKSTGRIVALKRVKMEHEKDGFPITSVREINILLNFHHPNIVRVEEVAVSPRHLDQIYMVMEYMDHDLKSLMEDKKRFSQPFSAGQVKCLMQQLLAGIAFLHNNWVLHRDLKTSNILYNSKGDLKLCDFGMARQYGDPLGTYTHNVVTLWYRAPELLFGCEKYDTAMDMWSVGCIMGEILTGKPLLPGQGEFDQIDKMVQLLGTPTEDEWPGLKNLPNFKKINLKQVPSTLRQRFTAATGFVGTGTNLTEAGFDLLSRLLAWDPDQRINAQDALNHRWFSEVPLPVARVLMPTFAPRRAG